MKTTLMIAAIVLLAINLSLAEVPRLINYQGRLTDAGAPVADGSYSVVFTLYDQATEGAALWNEIQNVTTSGGVFTVLLGTNNPLSQGLFSESTRYLGITVGANPEMTPRVQVVATAFAFRSDKSANADSLNGHAPAYYLSWVNLTGVPAGFADGVDNVGGSGDITGVTAGEGLAGGGTSGTISLYLDTAGVLTKHIANGTIINEDISGSAAIAVNKIAGTAMTLTTTQNVLGTKNFGGEVSIGDSTMTVNDNGIVVGTDAFGPSLTYMMSISRNSNTASSRYGLYANTDNAGTGTVYGVLGRASSTTAGAANAGNAYGVRGYAISDGANRYGVYAFSDAITNAITTGNSYGVYAQATDGDIAYGLKSYAGSATDGYGLYCEVTGNGSGTGTHNYVHDNTSSVAIGTSNHVYDNGNNAYAVAGTAGGNSGTGYGVFGYAYNNGTNWAGYFSGDVNVTGTIVKSAAKTLIDHPLDPENQNLLLTGVDSPEMVVKTSGNIVTDAAGEATVVLRDYFVAIAANFRYQLTVIGQFAQAIVGEEISSNQFQIKTDRPGVKVSWEVTGERIDSYAKTSHSMPEVPKTAEQRGRYRHPEAFGKSPERSVDFPMVQELSRAQNTAKSATPEAEEQE